ncbi:MAG: hypothetical protein WC477_06840 [Patescibacteria group bacterium]
MSDKKPFVIKADPSVPPRGQYAHMIIIDDIFPPQIEEPTGALPIYKEDPQKISQL